MAQFLADLTMAIHFLWIVFLVTGLALAWRWPRLVFVHWAGLAFAGVLAAGGCYCPLTYLEDWFRGQAGPGGMTPSFIGYWLERLIYLDLPHGVLRLAGGLFVALNLGGYVWWWKRRRRANPGLDREGRSS